MSGLLKYLLSASDAPKCNHCQKGLYQFHLLHPCEVCGRIAGKGDWKKRTIDDYHHNIHKTHNRAWNRRVEDE